MNQTVRNLLKETDQLQRPLPVPKATMPVQAILHQAAIPLSTEQARWEHRGRGRVASDSAQQVELFSKTRYESWPIGGPQDGDYIQYGQITAALRLPHEDWQRYNQLSFTATVDCQNVINPNITLSFVNDGVTKIPDKYNREGHHSVNLTANQTTYRLNIADLPRDAVTEISITTAANGSYLNLAGQIHLTFSDFQLEAVAQAPVTEGWLPEKMHIIGNQVGYQPKQRKIMLYNAQPMPTDFKIVNVATEQPVYHGSLTPQKLPAGNATIGVADFSDFQELGKYQLQIADQVSAPFAIKEGSDLWAPSVLKELNFIYAERCGYPVPGIHGTCHQDVTASHQGTQIAFSGGWHDAGDLSQQTVHTAEVALSLLRAADCYRVTEPDLAQRLTTEARWGFDFVLKTRFGDGYRATSAGVSRWTDNQVGNFDDAVARVHNNPYENYLFAGIECHAAQLIGDDPTWSQQLLQVAQEDYQFAAAQFKATPYAAEPIMWEHTYNTSRAIYEATVAWTAAGLAEATGQADYRRVALSAGERLLACQEQTGLALADGTVLKGMFYRDASHRVFQHFNHQAREHMLAAALTELVAISKGQEQQGYLTAARNYGDYLLYLQQFTDPYPMLAAGIYRDDEASDSDSFYQQNLLVDQSAEAEFGKQLKQGVQVAPHLYIKRFPVWFSFRGNNGVLLSMGRSAAILGNLLQDSNLSAIGADQLSWITGMNPFGQSLIYGLGQYFDHQYSVSSGEMVGEIPVGIETNQNSDQPFWPQFNNATYKEVWIANAGKWLALVAELLENK